MRPRPIELCDRAQELLSTRMGVPLMGPTAELQLADERASEALATCQGCDFSRLKRNGAHLCALANGEVLAELRSAIDANPNSACTPSRYLIE